MSKFIRAIWGENDKIKNDVSCFLEKSVHFPFTIYCFGRENYNFIIEKGFKDVVLLSEENFLFHGVSEQYIHKIYVMKKALEHFDEVIFVDWDVILLKELPKNFWELFHEGEDIKAPLYYYEIHLRGRKRKKNKKLPEGYKDPVSLPSAAFVYLRNYYNGKRLYEIYEEFKYKEEFKNDLDEEKILRFFIEEKMNGWKDHEFYLNNFSLPIYVKYDRWLQNKNLPYLFDCKHFKYKRKK